MSFEIDEKQIHPTEYDYEALKELERYCKQVTSREEIEAQVVLFMDIIVDPYEAIRMYRQAKELEMNYLLPKLAAKAAELFKVDPRALQDALEGRK